MIEKPFLELKDQINLLKSRGLIFDDEKEFNAKYVVNSVKELYDLINEIM